MNQSLAAISADLWRISSWLARGQDQLAHQFLDRINPQDLPPKIGPILPPQELTRIISLEGGRLRAADRALTLSRLLYFHSL